MTQPFPLTSKTRKLRSTDTISRIGVAHNGIINMTNDAKTMSDTALFIKRYMSFLIKDVEYYRNEKYLDIIETLIGSRMAILSSDGHCELLGHGWKLDDGVWYSNESYKSYSRRSYTKTNWKDWYGYYDGYGYDYDDDETELKGYLDIDTWNQIAMSSIEEDAMSEEELDEWIDFRENCQDRIDTVGASCYACSYVSSCYAI